MPFWGWIGITDTLWLTSSLLPTLCSNQEGSTGESEVAPIAKNTFESLRAAPTVSPIFHNLVFKFPFLAQSDASKMGLGPVLS